MEEKTVIWKKAYEDILKVCKKYKNFYDEYGYRDIKEMIGQAESHLYYIELYEKYGIELEHKNNICKDDIYIRINDYVYIASMGEKYRRTVSWEDNGKQPEDEILVCLGFSTGPYTFGEDYPVEIFKDFFNELKEYNPKFIDTTNKNLYFTLDNSKDIIKNFNNIKNKYHERYRNEYKERQVEKLKKEIERLENK